MVHTPMWMAGVATAAMVLAGVGFAWAAEGATPASGGSTTVPASVLRTRLLLRDGWRLQSSGLVKEDGPVVSTGQFSPAGWHATTVPSTVLAALIRGGVYPDIRVGLNGLKVPDSSDEFNRAHDLAKYSHLPGGRNPWKDPWWYRTEFTLPALAAGRRVWLHLDAINYRADVWLNGRAIADRKQVAGMFQRFQFDITDAARAGANVLAVKIYPVDHPGTPETQLEVFGRDRPYVGKEIMRDVTEIMTIGYDCMMTVPDRNMGLWQEVWVDWTGEVDIRDPFVITHLPLPATDRATLTISAELANTAAAPVKGTLRGAIAGTDVQFQQAVELAPHEVKVVTIDPRPVMAAPRLWWPVNYGPQNLYDLDLRFELAGGQLSAERRVTFGVRQVGYEMHERQGWHGRRVLVNGQRIFCRGGYIQPELLLEGDARRMEAEIRYYAGANMNLIYFEDIPNPPAAFLELCDRYGVLFGNVFYSCYWLRPGTSYPDDLPLLERCTVDILKRYRNHPSLVMYMAMNENDTRQDVYEMWRRHVLALDGTRWFIPSAYFPSGRTDVPEWFRKDLPAGMTDIGASYTWKDPAWYYDRVREGRNWMFMMESGSASLPPISSLSRFIPNLAGDARDANAPEDAGIAKPAKPAPFPLDATWAHHGANHYYKDYDLALRRLFGEPTSVADYCWKGHLTTADQHRAIFEAVNHRMWDITSGMTQWKINACEPSVQWQLFDWYLKPMVSYYYTKRACEPLHVQLAPDQPVVSVINTHLVPHKGMEVRARVYDLDSKLRSDQRERIDVEANTAREALTIAEPPEVKGIHFVRLDLHDAGGRELSRNFYWRAGKAAANFRALAGLPMVTLETSYKVVPASPDSAAVRVAVRNPTGHLALLVQLAVTKGPGGAEVLPVLWDDNYFALLPGESRELTAMLASRDLGDAQPALEVGGWNVQTAFECTALAAGDGQAEVPAGRPLKVVATIARTFLDGSRVVLLVDGQPAESTFAWARGTNRSKVEFTVRPGPGRHTFAIAGKAVSVLVR